MSDLKVVRTQRGFEVISFVDAYGKLCSLQQSSAIDGTEEGLANPGSSFVWLGVDVLATAVAGVDPTVGKSRMHLSRDQVSQLIGYLQKWCDTGSFDQAAADDNPFDIGLLTDEQIVAKGLELARMLYKAHGYEVPEGFKFYDSQHPQEQSMWNLACIAFEELTGTDLNDALANCEEDDE